jgi:hypothetical protein
LGISGFFRQTCIPGSPHPGSIPGFCSREHQPRKLDGPAYTVAAW